LFNLLILNPSSVLATNPEPLKWTKVNIPAQGSAGGWVLADHSDIKCLTAAPDGTLYASVAGLANTLYKSTDGVKRWSPVGDVHDDIIDIAVSPNDAKTIYYATATSIFRSSDGGKNFLRLPSVPTRSGASITSIDVSWLNNNVIAVGTADANSAEFGGVYTLEEAEIFPGWADTNIGNYDVFAVDFSPDYITGQQIVAVVSDEIATFVFNKIGNADWNAFIGPARLNKNNANPPAGIVPSQAAIAFPGSYQTYASSFFFVGINTGVGEGDVYKITCADAPGNSAATDLNCGGIYGAPNTDVSSLAVYSDSQHDLLLAGSSIGSQIYISQDWGASWNNSSKQPTGNAVTGIVFSPDFSSNNEIYAATSGNGSAISISRDIGLTWNQIGLIDTAISNIVDFVPSPDSSQINAMFLITFASGSGHSLWRSLDDGVSWERILSSDSPGVDVLSLVTLPPEYSSDCLTLFIYGESNHTPAIWNSEDNGQSFRCSITRAPSGSTPFSVHAWAVANKNAVYLGGDDGTIYLMTANGYNYLKRGSAGDSQPYSLALSPDFVNDGNLLVGNLEGEVFWSSDGGSSFQSLPADISSPPLDGAVSVAFDPNFNTNHTVYAAGAASDNGIYRFIIGSSEVWESIHTTLPAGASINRLAVSADGVLYAANSNADGGMERCLNPRFSLTPVFESVTRGLNDGATLSGLWRRHNQLWAIDLINVKLMSFNDTLTSPVMLVAPNDNSTGIGALSAHTVKDITIDWDSMSGITDYAWQCSYDTDFSTIPDGLSGTTSASSVRLPPLEPATTYYWRVRASSPVFSPWSAKWTFTTTMDTETINLELESPLPGAAAVSIKPVFQWTAILGAEAYELLVATDDDFINPVIIKIGEYALKTNAWNCDIALYFDTVYYWKIRAVTASTSSAWSSVGIFNTELLPNETPTLPTRQPELLTVLSTPKLVPSTAPSTTAASQLFDMPAWIIYLFAGLFCIVFLSLLIVLIIVIKIKSL
jgi:photosystem II stability/assembly factor-like uncharacterized protein